MKTVIYLTLLLPCFLFTSCQYDPYAENYTTTQPNKESLVGTYCFESQTIDMNIKDTCFSKTTIILYGDMHYRAFNIPYFKSDTNYNYKYHGLISKQGKWNIETIGGVDNGLGKENPVWGVRLDSMPRELEFVGLMQNKAPYKLIIGFGDPDAGDVMIFKYGCKNRLN